MQHRWLPTRGYRLQVSVNITCTKIYVNLYTNTVVFICYFCREQQCAEFNKRDFKIDWMNKTQKWVPKYGGNYLKYSRRVSIWNIYIFFKFTRSLKSMQLQEILKPEWFVMRKKHFFHWHTHISYSHSIIIFILLLFILLPTVIVVLLVVR